MPLRLKVQNTAAGSSEEVVLNQHHIQVGRLADCDVSIRDEAVAEHQLAIIQEPHHILLAEGPSGTSSLNGERLSPNQIVKISNKDRITFGPIQIEVEVVQSPEKLLLPDESNEQLRRMVWDKLSKFGFSTSAFIKIISGLDAGHSAVIPDNTEGFSIGSNPACDLTLKDPASLPIHFTIRQQNHTFYAHPKKNAPILLNNIPLAEPAPLYDNDIITVGAQVLQFLDPPQKNARLIDPTLVPDRPDRAPTAKAPPVPYLLPFPPTTYNSLQDTFPFVGKAQPPQEEPPKKQAPDRVLTAIAILLFICSLWLVLLVFNIIAM